MKKMSFRFILLGIVLFKQCTKVFIKANLNSWLYDLFFCLIYFFVLCIAIKKDGFVKNMLCILYFLYSICLPIFYTIYNFQDDIYLKLKVAQYEYSFLCISGMLALFFMFGVIMKLVFYLTKQVKRNIGDGSKEKNTRDGTMS